MKTRIEHDSLWSLQVPKDVPWGIYTQRVLTTYPQSGVNSVPEILLREYISAKMVYATVNTKHKKIDAKTKKAIHSAVKMLLKMDSEEFMQYFPIGQIQSGGGTSTNMMINEVLANVATKQLGIPYGTYSINSHDHLNASQSSNDTFPGVGKLTVLKLVSALEQQLEKLINTFGTQAKDRKKIQKVGRTHLQDAVIVSLWEEFGAYARTIQKNLNIIKQAKESLLELNFGGTATGSLQNITPALRKDLVAEFTKVYKTKFRQAKSYFEQNSSSSDFARVSQSFVLCANNLIKIGNDMRLLSSGPLAGLGEIQLPSVQPGSSIMPGKVNPSAIEALTMACAAVIGNDQTIHVLTRQSQLQLQQFMPGIVFPLIDSAQTLTQICQMFCTRCIEWIKPNKERIQTLLEWSFAYATDYSEQLWYETVARLVQKALKEKRNLRELLEGEM